MCRSRPADTATRALFLLMPVAKALMSGESKIATSGMPMPAARAWRRTVSTNQSSVDVAGVSITWAPVMRFAVHLEMASEMNDPPMPKTAAKIRSDPGFSPCWVRYGSTPSSRSVSDSTRTMARLVARNSTTRFMFGSWRLRVRRGQHRLSRFGRRGGFKLLAQPDRLAFAQAQVEHFHGHRERHGEVEVTLRNMRPETFADKRDAHEDQE